jgi:arylsulfatase A-like enzyme
MSGKKLAWATGLLVLVLAVVIGRRYTTLRSANPAPQFNVVLITLDTTRVDRLGCYGHAGSTSPRIDRFAEAGALFTKAYCTASVTPVSHASILTGQEPYTHGLRVLHGLDQNYLPESAVTLTEVLRDHGYTTAAFISAFPAGSRFGLAQGFDTFDEAFLQAPVEEIVSANGTVNTGRNQRRAGDTTDLALDWLGGSAGTFFLWLHYFDPHDARMLPPPEYMARFPDRSGPAADRLRAVYDIEIRYMDEHIGRVLDALEATGRLEDTVVVIVSDHGQGLGDHDWWTHGILYQEQIKASLILRGPGIPRATLVPGLVSITDIMPTVLELVGLDPDEHATMDGRSLVPMLASGTPAPGRIVYADSVNLLTYGSASGFRDEKNDMLFAVTDGEWKYIHHLIREDASELYHLAEDPGELNNLYAEHPEHVERLRDDLASREFQPDQGQGRGRMSPEDLERLRSLGYLR